MAVVNPLQLSSQMTSLRTGTTPTPTGTTSPTPNFETVTGQKVSTPLYPTTSSVGVQAKSPNTNITPPANTIPKSQTVPSAPITPAPTGYAATDPNRIINNVTGQTAGQAASTPAGTPAINSGNTGGQTPNGATVDANGNVITPAPGSTGLYGQLVNSLASTSQGNLGLGQNAQNIGNNFAGQIKNLENQAVTTGATVGDQGISPVALGRAGQISQNVGAQIQGLTQAENAQLAGNSQAITAQGQAQSGLAAAGQLSTPANQFITQPFNTQLIGADGQPIGGASGNSALQGAVVNAIDLIKNGSGYTNAVSAANLGQFGPQGTTALLNALGPSFNSNLSDSEAAAVAQNVNTQGTAGTSASANAYNTAVQNVSKVTGQYTAATGVAQNLTSALGNWTQTGLLTNVNQAINQVAGLTSSPQYAQFLTALTNTQAAYTAAFQTAGITPTQSTQNALQELNPNSSASTIVASLNQLSSDLHAATVVPAYQQQETYGQQLGIQ